MLGIPESEYDAMMKRLKTYYREIDRKIYEQNLLDELRDPSYWKSLIEGLEQEREYFNKKRGWSAMDVACVDRIDAQIQECIDELDRIYVEEDRLEAEYD